MKLGSTATDAGNRAFIIILSVYILVELFTVPVLMSINPRYDFHIYENALAKTLAGSDPYDIRELGPAFIYPPPALFVIEVFDFLIPAVLRKTVFLIINILILVLIILKIAAYFGLSIRETWFWFPLGFFFAPYFATVQVGQINLVTELGVLIFFVSTVPILAALALALAITTKLTPLAFLFYSFVTKNGRVIVYSLLALVLIFAAGLLHYGVRVHLTYLDVFKDLLIYFPIAQSSQSFVSKVWMVSTPSIYPALFQRIFMVWLALLVLSSGYLTAKTKDAAPLFIVLGLAITISPNIMWYHHYVFLLLPLFTWMAWRKLDQRLVLWIMTGMTIIQIDYYFLTTGFMIHLLVQFSILCVIYQQYSGLRQSQSLDNVVTV
jgi:hypothetical protein